MTELELKDKMPVPLYEPVLLGLRGQETPNRWTRVRRVEPHRSVCHAKLERHSVSCAVLILLL